MEKNFLNDNVLVQLECREEHGKTIYNVVVFFRYTHEVQIIKTTIRSLALKKYNFIVDLCSK